ncbi:MAG TPA: DUF4393 domain-containing protein [Thermoanaerobaculia bacterium]|jgi:hypothetical protein
MPESQDDAKNALVALGVGPAAKELYMDLLKPAAAELGGNLETIAKVVTLAMAPLRGMVWGAEKIQDWLSAALLQRLARVSSDKIQTPPLNVAGQIMLQLPFCSNEHELREMYANLLAASMNADTVHVAHPAFVHVIQQLTSDEAVVLKHIAAQNGFELRERVDDVGVFRGETGRIVDQFQEMCRAAGAKNPDASGKYLDNFLRLKILAEDRWSESEYHPGGVSDWGDYGPSVASEHRRLIVISDFGEAFVQGCVPREQ